MPHLAIINRFPAGHTYPLGEALIKLGYQVQLCQLRCVTARDGVCVNDLPLQADVVLWRVGEKEWASAINLLAACEAQGIKTLNSSQAIAVCANKWQCHHQLQQSGLPSVPSSLVTPGSIITPLPDRRIIKPVYGAGGEGVTELAGGESVKVSALSLLQTHLGGWENFARINIVGGRSLGGMQRQTSPGKQVNNLQQGGQARAWAAPAEAEQLAIAAAAACGTEIAAVDVVHWDNKWWVLEINSSPGYSGMIELHGPAYHDHLAAAISRLLI